MNFTGCRFVRNGNPTKVGVHNYKHTSMSSSRKLAALLWLSSAVSLAAQTTNLWTGAGADNDWSAPANWGGVAPQSGSALTFSGKARQTNTNDLTGLTNLNTITFSTAGWSLSGNAVTVTNGFVANISGSNTWGLDTTLNNSVAISQNAGSDVLNFTGVLSGPGGVAPVPGVSGTGTIYLSNTNNSFTGNASINSATAVVYSVADAGQNSSLGAGSGTVTFGSTETSYEGALIYAGTNSCSTSRAFQGQARTGGSPLFSNNSPNNSSLTFNGGWSGRGYLNPFTLLLEGSSTGANIFNGSISQSFYATPYTVSLQVNGPGTWVFAADNTYLGTTTINGGVLQLGGGGTTGNAGTNSINFATDGTLTFNRSDAPVFGNNLILNGSDSVVVANGGTVTLGGTISGSGNLVVNSPNGTLLLTNASIYNGNTIISAGRLSLGGSGSLANSPVISIAPGAVLDVSAVNGGFSPGPNQTILGMGATGTINGSVNLGNGALALALTPGAPALTITDGTLALNSNSVTVTVSGGAALAGGRYPLIVPGGGGWVTGSVTTSRVLANNAGGQVLSLQITNGGLWLAVSPQTATIPIALSLGSSLNPSIYGTVPVIFTAMASPAPTNSEAITFLDGTNLLAVCALTNGLATFSTATLSLGTHLITAFYGGDALFLANTSSVLTQVVNQVAACYPQGAAFPLLMYEISPNYPTLSAYGWNIMQEYGLNTNSDVNNFLQELLSNNQAGPAVIPDNGTSDPYTGWTQSQVQTWVQSMAGNPNLAWWYLPEQMFPWYPSETNLLNNYTAWTRLYDPQQRPTCEYTENSFNDADVSGVIRYVDVVGISCYCEELGMPHAWVRYKLQQAGAGGAALAGKTLGGNYLAGQKTLVAVLSIARFTANSPSEASPAQTYHDFWSAIASGARGIAAWSYYHDVNDDPANLTNNLNELNLAASQITGPEQIGSMIIEGAVNSNVTFAVTSGPTNTVSFIPPGESTSFQYPSINVLSKTWNGCVYVIAVNSTSNTVAATFSNIPSTATAAQLPFETRSVPLTNGTFSDSFAAWGVHIYKMAVTNTLVAPILYATAAISGAGLFTASFSGTNGQSYRVLTSTNLALPFTNWLVLTNGTFDVNLMSFTDHAATNIQRFYRVTSP